MSCEASANRYYYELVNNSPDEALRFTTDGGHQACQDSPNPLSFTIDAGKDINLVFVARPCDKASSEKTDPSYQRYLISTVKGNKDMGFIEMHVSRDDNLVDKDPIAIKDSPAPISFTLD